MKQFEFVSTFSLFFMLNIRDSVDWPLVRCKAAEIVGDLMAQIPEFDDICRLPHCPRKPSNVLPIVLRYGKFLPT